MTTLVLQAAGSAIGSFFGPFGEMLGRAAGAVAGNAIDQSLLGGGTRRIVGPRLREMDGLTASEGEPIPRLYGRARLGGQLIWATRFEEEVVTTVRKARGGKGGAAPKTRETGFSYFANLAIALCEGEIAFVRRVWADGREIDLAPLAMRVHAGSAEQEPDPLIVAKEGADKAPAYRGTAYVVFERFPLAPFGNRVPQFAFEVVRTVAGLGGRLRSVNLIPGSSEFAYEPARVDRIGELGASQAENRAQLQAPSDVLASLDQLQALCPNLTGVNLVVSWFGDDLRAGLCSVAPRVDQAGKQTSGAAWQVAGLARGQARLVTMIEGRAAYGGTPSDASVLALIAELKARGLKVTLYPFIMMDVGPANALPDPRGGGAQPAFPWRGRITCNPAPGQPGTADATAAAAAQVAAFIGTVAPADMSVEGGAVQCAKPEEWSFRRHVLHCAALAQAAGGVDGFIIGTEMVGLTRVRSEPGVYPFVGALAAIAADVRAMLGPGTRLTYAADWTEHGAHVLAGGQEVRFPLDPLWASPAIDAVGIDYYPPISDWRDGAGHADAALARSAADLSYLAGRQRAGEAFDWFYVDPASRAAQQRRPITDGAYGKPWIFRPKDLAGWWLNAHYERVGGVELPAPTPWLPAMKPIWLTEIGCPAVDKGANAPNVFPDTRSSEGGLPFFSNGERDDLLQNRALTAQIGVLDPASPFFDPVANPFKPGAPSRMIDMRDVSVWAWDARPFPAFPMLTAIWADGGNWRTGHWLNGRLENAPVDELIGAILRDYGLPALAHVSCDDLVDGYVLDRAMSAREALEPLARLFALETGFGPDGLRMVSGTPAAASIELNELVAEGQDPLFTRIRGQETELPRELRLAFIDGDFEYRRAVGRSRRLAGQARREASIEAPVVMPRARGEQLAEMRLRDAWIGRERLSFALSPRRIDLEPGDLVRVPVEGAQRLFRIVAITDGPSRQIEAVRAEPEQPPRIVAVEAPRAPERPPLAGRPFLAVLELPAARGEPAPLLHLAVRADPWPGVMTIQRGADGGAFLNWGQALRPALVGRTLTDLPPGPVWRWDAHGAVEIELAGGALQSTPETEALAGANSFALQGPDGAWEIVTAASAELVGERRYRLARLLRGLAGSEAAAGRSLPAGALLVALDEALTPVAEGPGDVGRALRLRVLPQGSAEGDASIATIEARAVGLALRPLAPVHVRARRAGDGVTFSWIRQARRDADNWDLSDPPLGEASERYRFSIHAGGSLLRQVETTSPRFFYPAAAELADFGAAQTHFDAGVAQISEVLGPGAERRGAVAARFITVS